MKTKRQLRKENEVLTALLADVTEKAEALLPKVEQIVKERDALRKNVYSYAQRASDLGYENFDLLEKVAALEAEVYDLEAELSDLQYEIDEDEQYADLESDDDTVERELWNRLLRQ